MNIAEAQLLNGSLDDLSRTLMANKLEARRAQEAQQRLGLAGQEMDLRRNDLEEQRANRASMLKNAEDQNKNLAAYHQQMLSAKSDEDKFKIFTDMVKNGAVTPESLDAMSKAMSEKLGVQVQLKLPDNAGPPAVWEDKVSGRRFGYRPGSKEMHDLTPNMGEVTEETDPADPTGALKRRIKRKLTPEELRSAAQGPPRDEAAGPTPQQQAEMDEIERRPGIPASGPVPKAATAPAGDRVTVISPDGTRGSIPRAQLQKAIAEGYKVAR